MKETGVGRARTRASTTEIRGLPYCMMPVSLYTNTMPPSLSIMPHTRGLLTMDGCAMQNFGYTVEQEGDSFALVFEEPSDAVKFCLQVSACERK